MSLSYKFRMSLMCLKRFFFLKNHNIRYSNYRYILHNKSCLPFSIQKNQHLIIMTIIHKLKIPEKIKVYIQRYFRSQIFIFASVNNSLACVHTPIEWERKCAWNHIKLHQSPPFLLFLYFFFLANIKNSCTSLKWSLIFQKRKEIFWHWIMVKLSTGTDEMGKLGMPEYKGILCRSLIISLKIKIACIMSRIEDGLNYG